MKNKKVVIGLGIFAVIAIIIGIIIASFNLKDVEDKNILDVLKNANDIERTEDNDYGYTEEKLVDMVNYMNTFDSIAVIKADLTTVEYEDGTYDFITRAHVVSAVEFAGDYETTISIDDENDLEQTTLDFQEYFGFDWKECSKPMDIFVRILDNNGFDADIEGGELNQALYGVYGQRSYVIECDEKLVDDYMEGIDYDEITSAYWDYIVEEDTNGNDYINYVRLIIDYTKGTTKYSREIDFVFYVYDAVYDSNDMGCGCGSDTDCNSGNDCESGCEM